MSAVPAVPAVPAECSATATKAGAAMEDGQRGQQRKRPRLALIFGDPPLGHCISIRTDDEGSSPPPCHPLCVILVLDTSFSMGDPAKAEGTAEKGGFSVLDVVKHAAKTIACMLGEEGVLGVVEFSCGARRRLPPFVMDNAGREAAYLAIESLEINGTTNLLAGLDLGFSEAAACRRRGQNSCLLVLTDGVPNRDNTPESLLEAVASRQSEGESPVLHTFGFGNKVMSGLLAALAKKGNGVYRFISDPNLVGSVMINAVANAQVSAGVKASLRLRYAHGFECEDVQGFEYGQSRDVPLTRLDLPESVTLIFESPFGPEEMTLLASRTATAGEEEDLRGHRSRVALGQLLTDPGLQELAEGPGDHHRRLEKLKHFHAAAQALADQAHSQQDPFSVALARDVRDQVFLALSAQHFWTWGFRYLLALGQAHLRQQCMNFKDEALQFYGGSAFAARQTEGDCAFDKLPPPTASLSRARPTAQGQGQQQQQQQQQRAVASMRNFNDPGGGCFRGSSEILLASAETRPVQALARGDRVAVRLPNGREACATVLCVVEMRPPPSGFQLVTLPSGLTLTPWHPVQEEGRWSHPWRLPGAQPAQPAPGGPEPVYNLLLDAGHVVRVAGQWAATLAHGLQAELVRHPFWGTSKVLDSLAALPGFELGRVCVRPAQLRRNADGVCGFAP